MLVTATLGQPRRCVTVSLPVNVCDSHRTPELLRVLTAAGVDSVEAALGKLGNEIPDVDWSAARVTYVLDGATR